MLLIAISLIVMGIILYVVDKRAKSEVSYEKITLKQSVLIGISQALAAAFPRSISFWNYYDSCKSFKNR